MKSRTADTRKSTEAIYLLILAGALPLCGCAASTRTMDKGAAAPARPLENGPALADAGAPLSPPGNPAIPPGSSPGAPPASMNMQGSYPMPAAPMDRADGSFASSGVRDLPPQPPYPPIRLVGEQSALPSAPSGTSQPPSPRVAIARMEPRLGGGLARPSVLHANQSTFEQLVLRSDVPVLVDFYATWCGPCKVLAPTLDEVASETPQARVVKVNIDDSPELAARYGVKSVPSLMVFRDGQVVAKQQGVVSKTQLTAMLDR